MYFSANEVPFGAKGSTARKEFMRKEYNKPRTLKSAGAALNNGEDAMYLQREVERVAARGQDEQDPAFAWPAEGSLTGTGATTGSLRRASVIHLTLALAHRRPHPALAPARTLALTLTLALALMALALALGLSLPQLTPDPSPIPSPIPTSLHARPPRRSARATSGRTTCRASRLGLGLGLG